MKQGVWRRWSAISIVATGAIVLTSGCGSKYFVLHPAGPVGEKELHVILWSAVLTLLVIVPVLMLLAWIVWRYRDRPNNKAKYTPEWSESRLLEIVWWGIPIVIIGILGVYTGKVTFALTQPPEKDAKPLTVYVTSLDWKWLFQYPGQKIATVNYLNIPTGVPINFELTSDAPMNSFWVPSLGGQEYTMPGMATRLWLEADKPGTYYGHGANFTGSGFADMSFHVKAESPAQFNAWVKSVRASAHPLTTAGYKQLRKPSTVGDLTFSSFPPNLFNNTVWAEGGRYMQNSMPSMSSTVSTLGKNRGLTNHSN
ncbi:ubiquinol oxidase subunit II [Alicyclobacillus acidiphilus]|uniref:ubiquinol oxidase subunit II n=1 Tax=Alicyclobacillus acidiphilus TaxID=182455 RepID=UPI00082DE893|nr:ubiquinol oxidase subunit II [Alicyclobacillus acidiphilus]